MGSAFRPSMEQIQKHWVEAAATALARYDVPYPAEEAAEIWNFVCGPTKGAGRDEGGAIDYATLDKIVKRRTLREPLAYILGKTTFAGIDVLVGPEVFAPRPHSLSVWEWAKEHLGHLIKPRVAELCCGTAAFSIALAKALSSATFVAVDSEKEAIQWALKNLRLNGSDVQERIELVVGNILEQGAFISYKSSFDLVYANPPYVPYDEELIPEFSQYYPKKSVFSGPTGYELIDASIRLGSYIVRNGGWLAIEHARDQQNGVKNRLKDIGLFSDTVSFADAPKKAAFTIALRNDMDEMIGGPFMHPLKSKRDIIDSIDDKIIDLIGKRMNVCREVALEKLQNNLSIMQTDRVEEVKSRCAKNGEKYSLREPFIRDLYQRIIDEACSLEESLLKK